ncbi:hypothetical protein JCM3770_000715 [Rhodotorula araucariae]
MLSSPPTGSPLHARPYPTFLAPVVDASDLFSPHHIRVFPEGDEGLCPRCTVADAGADGADADDANKTPEAEAWHSLKSGAYDDHLALKHGISPDFHDVYGPPVVTRTSAVTSLFGAVADSFCGACGVWVMGAAVWAPPGDYVDGLVPCWRQWYAHARDCHADASGLVAVVPSPPSPSQTPAVRDESYRPLFPPAFAAGPLASLPPPVFAPATATELAFSAWHPALALGDGADTASDPTASPLDARAPDAESESSASATAAPDDSPVAARVAHWQREMQRAWVTAGLARARGRARRGDTEAEKENDPGAAATRWSFRPRGTKPAAVDEGGGAGRAAKRAREA